LRIFERLLQTRRIAAETRLLIVGIPGPETPAIQKFVAASGIANSIILLNGISDAQLNCCYRDCALLLAPSRIEGFGLPVAESMLAGCRVVCSDIPAFRELGANYCHFVSLGPREIDAFVEAVSAALNMARPKPVALPQLSEPVIAEQVMQLYRSLLPAWVESTESYAAPFLFAGER
jgi:glycosyltransferase involved in cell wall biosynthesis